MPPEVKAAYSEVEKGVKHLGKAMSEVQQGLRRAEKKIEADARARIRALRQDARMQLAGLKTQRREVSRTLRSLATAAEGSFQDVKRSADVLLAEARTTAASVVERLRGALGK
jgi:hypothetical protein